MSKKISGGIGGQRGFEFQDYAAIVLFLDNIKAAKWLQVEGHGDQDIVIKAQRKIVAQAKHKSNSSSTSAKKNAEEALSKLESAKQVRTRVYVTNIRNYLGDRSDRYPDLPDWTDFYSPYDELEDKTIADERLKNSKLDPSSLHFRVIAMDFDEPRTCLCVVYRNLDRFLKSGGDKLIDRKDALRRVKILVEANKTAEKHGSKEHITKSDFVWCILRSLVDHPVIRMDSEWREAMEAEAANMRLIIWRFLDPVVRRIIIEDFAGNKDDEVPDFVEENWEKYAEQICPEEVDGRKHIVIGVMWRILAFRGIMSEISKDAAGIGPRYTLPGCEGIETIVSKMLQVLHGHRYELLKCATAKSTYIGYPADSNPMGAIMNAFEDVIHCRPLATEFAVQTDVSFISIDLQTRRSKCVDGPDRIMSKKSDDRAIMELPIEGTELIWSFIRRYVDDQYGGASADSKMALDCLRLAADLQYLLGCRGTRRMPRKDLVTDARLVSAELAFLASEQRLRTLYPDSVCDDSES